MSKFIIKTSNNTQYYFVLKAGNGETILTSETYISKQNAVNGINAIKQNAPIAVIEDKT